MPWSRAPCAPGYPGMGSAERGGDGLLGYLPPHFPSGGSTCAMPSLPTGVVTTGRPCHHASTTFPFTPAPDVSTAPAMCPIV
eukprot:1122190-Prorocentrum_minimum.AAC.1